ncbi:MAG: hypothetical protein FWF06_06365 [Symbiobacteriaceae bacterium]|nr:hypothetical protein [Symbiobacteriaceae bacterium]
MTKDQARELLARLQCVVDDFTIVKTTLEEARCEAVKLEDLWQKVGGLATLELTADLKKQVASVDEILRLQTKLHELLTADFK